MDVLEARKLVEEAEKKQGKYIEETELYKEVIKMIESLSRVGISNYTLFGIKKMEAIAKVLRRKGFIVTFDDRGDAIDVRW